MFEEKKPEWLETAERLKPALRFETVQPISGIPDHALMENEDVVLDFGNHFVGHLTLKVSSQGSHPDAPAWLSIKFCENARELDETLEGYNGWISKSWVQQEQVHIDVLPAVIHFPRRYAFRFVKIKVLALSSKYRLVIEDAVAETTTSVDDNAVSPLIGDEADVVIDRVALRTLRNCMQDFFEDGPKRDRRLWLGDLRLQALTNSVTYRNFDLVKRCLYLFAATSNEEGRIAACLFTEPIVEADDTFMFDYSLFFIPTLLQYVQATGDNVTKDDLLPLAWHQLKLADAQFDPDTNLIRDCDRLGWCFVDWALKLNKQFCAQAIWIYCAEAALQMNDDPALEEKIAARKDAAKKHWYDEELHLFVSDTEHQISWASQVWAVLAGILEGEEAAACLDAVASCPDAVQMVTPYMMHHYVEALCCVNRKAQARQVIRDYWGAMVSNGADTFWELFNPVDPYESPYGSHVVNSFCHAWSCTPAWFLRCGILEDRA
ncbi:MAG: hypothetical protein ILP14_09355 [Oscillospiraceae bacterium]|nr:hypothetical protein [Oscillospiraceae bacterium]